MKRSLCVTGLLLIIGIKGAMAQEAEIPADPQTQQDIQMLPGFKDQAVVLDIQARVIEQNLMEIWNESHRRVTIPGRPVGIKMVGANVVVAAQFVPYLRRRGQNILVAQGQIWIEIPGQGIRYQTTMQTIPLAFNEPVYFFPLGSSEHSNEARIEIVLTMRSYKDSVETEIPLSKDTAGENSAQ
jgi:hypothetical protein